jgi:poly(3-hydroxybutyrate) depolymerase
MHSRKRTLGLLAGIWIILVGCIFTGRAIPSTPTSSPKTGLQAGDSTRSIQVGNLTRSYVVHVPPGLDADHAVPLV